jgi:hypothetical protein
VFYDPFRANRFPVLLCEFVQSMPNDVVALPIHLLLFQEHEFRTKSAELYEP